MAARCPIPRSDRAKSTRKIDAKRTSSKRRKRSRRAVADRVEARQRTSAVWRPSQRLRLAGCSFKTVRNGTAEFHYLKRKPHWEEAPIRLPKKSLEPGRLELGDRTGVAGAAALTRGSPLHENNEITLPSAVAGVGQPVTPPI